MSNQQIPAAGTTGGLPAYRRRVTQSKRASILKAADELFREQGFHNVGMVEIAKAAPVSTATLYKHFHFKGGKQRLFWECCRQAEKISPDHLESFVREVAFADFCQIEVTDLQDREIQQNATFLID